MKNIIMAFVAIACIVAGGVAGHFLKTGGVSAGPAGSQIGSAGAEDHGGSAEDDGHGNKKADEKEKKPAKADKHGGKGGASSSNIAYYKFTREFVVPMIGNGRVEGMVILNISLEVDAAQSQKLFSMEPALRDNIMTTLVGLSNDGKTFEAITNIENYETIRSMVLMNLQRLPNTGIQNVLILDMVRQDV